MEETFKKKKILPKERKEKPKSKSKQKHGEQHQERVYRNLHYKKPPDCELFKTIQQSIMKHSLSRLLKNKEIDFSEYDNSTKEILESHDQLKTKNNSFFNTCFDQILSFQSRMGYIEKLNQSPEQFYPENITRLTYYDVHDFFREPISSLKIDGTIINNENDQFQNEKPCEAGSYCWANRNNDEGGGYGIILRKFHPYDYCICCIREVVYKTYIKNRCSYDDFSNTEDDSKSEHFNVHCIIQPHYYIIDEPGIIVDNKFYLNYSSEYMITKNKDEPFVGIAKPFPIHTTERYNPSKIRIR